MAHIDSGLGCLSESGLGCLSANMAHIDSLAVCPDRQPRPDSALDFEVNVLKTF